jgi:hypothetical protein
MALIRIAISGWFESRRAKVGVDLVMMIAVNIIMLTIGVDIGFPDYDGVTLPFADESVDTVYSSHVLEHIRPHAKGSCTRSDQISLRAGTRTTVASTHQRR